MAGLFWKMAGLSTVSPIKLILDKSSFTLEDLLDEDEIIQECKSPNGRLVEFLKDKTQVQQMIHYIIDEPPEGADSKRAFKFPFISCQIITCEIESVLASLVEDKDLLGLLFSFLDPKGNHGPLLAGYFSKVVICLLIRQLQPVMQYFRGHEYILQNVVDLIGTTSIKEVLLRLVEAGDHDEESLHWLAGTNLLEMLVDKLRPQNSSEVHANAAEVLATISRTYPSVLATKLASPRFVATLFNHALEDPESKSALIHSLTVCISLLPSVGMSRSQAQQDTLSVASSETVDGMLQNLGNLLRLLDVSQDNTKLPTTYGELRPPFGIHRLKIVEFIGVLLRTHSEAVRQELVRLKAFQMILGFFFDYPFNSMLHSYVEAIITSCIDNGALLDNLFQECDLLSRLLATDENPYAPDTRPEKSSSKAKPTPKVGNMGHITRIANRLVQTGTSNSRVQNYLQNHPKWLQWQTTVLQQRNIVENIYEWSCGRPNSIRERPPESDDEEFRERDYDVSTMASNLTREVFRYGMFDNDDTEDTAGSGERDEEDVFFDDDQAEVIMSGGFSSIRLNDEQERFENNSPPAWFAFQEVEPEASNDENGGHISKEEDVFSENRFRWDDRNGVDNTSTSNTRFTSEELSGNAPFNLEYLSKDWANFQIGEEGVKGEEYGENNPFVVNFDDEQSPPETSPSPSPVEEEEATENSNENPNPSPSPSPVVESVPETDDDDGSTILVGVEPEGTAKAMESALREGIVGEAGPLKPVPVNPETGQDPGAPEFNDVNYWRSEYVAGEHTS